MSSLQDLLETAVAEGVAPGVAALVARGEEVEVATAGELEPDSIARLASITKPITAAAVMLLHSRTARNVLNHGTSMASALLSAFIPVRPVLGGQART